MNYNIVHRTLYEYAAPVAVSHHVARLEPRGTVTQACSNFSLKIFPEPALRKTRPDYFGNRLCFFTIQQIHRRFEIITASRVGIQTERSSVNESSATWESVAGMFCDPVSPEVVEPYQFIFDSPQVRASVELADYAAENFPKGRPLLAGTRDLTRRIFEDFKYDSKATTVATPLEEVWEKRRGVCQDFAHLGIACLRSLGLPARYVSGYLLTRPPEGKPQLTGVDASHAWFAIFCPGTGWVDFDPT
ncbi:MAG TPA: transglutaminase family protein, partial [Candidatus Acidoferrales bacterium]|nr:transglutaminase family protein [Candidatus Acidoferrales bacterium]